MRNIYVKLGIHFLVVAIIAAIFDFGGIVGAAAGIAKIIFFIFVVLLVTSLIINTIRGKTNHQKFREKHMTFIKKLSTTLIFFVAMFGLTACSEKDAEKAGDKVEEAVKGAGNIAKDAGDKLNEMKKDAGNALDAAGEKASEMKEDAGEAIEGAGEKVSEMASDAGHKLDEMKTSVSDKFGGMKKDASNAIEDACEEAKEGVDAEDDDC